MSRLAIIAGQGGLPAALAAACATPPMICALDGFTPENLKVDQIFRIERLALFLRHLEDQGISQIAFAGAVQRPRLDPSLFDPQTAQMVPRLLSAMGQGDDATLRAVIAIFEEAGFEVVGVEAIAPALLPQAAVLAGEITPRDESDATRAALITQALGAVDVGQGCVVAQGLCLAVEALPGTDAMLKSLGQIAPNLRPKGGLYYKAAKPDQDRRIDLPTMGLETLRLVAEAGLSGVAFQAGSVICLDLPAMTAFAQAQNLLLWAR
ncbi:phosphatidate cytidylyltransferase [Cypionkella aquatica]|uniref:Phosphatidate cytidylyltransferase n=1 Tax=Cypionkella aquatica TaxID=1756042 RepID=A0AA37X1E2_9RHOB|nr:UDP-2,3-diacylglucosamine diphosphatase LpxI [Cypionkella aquatica]GLS87857.1 phosphatidate cytidylyltransferase [Cypionkella aquatica]